MLPEACGSLCKVLFMDYLLFQAFVYQEKRSKSVYIHTVYYIHIHIFFVVCCDQPIV